MKNTRRLKTFGEPWGGGGGSNGTATEAWKGRYSDPNWGQSDPDPEITYLYADPDSGFALSHWQWNVSIHLFFKLQPFLFYKEKGNMPLLR